MADENAVAQADASLAQPSDFVRANIAEFAEERLAVLAELRRPAHLGVGIRKFDGTADRLIGPSRRIVDIEDHFAVSEMRIGQNFAGILTGAARHPRFTEQAHHLMLASFARPSGDQ